MENDKYDVLLYTNILHMYPCSFSTKKIDVWRSRSEHCARDKLIFNNDSYSSYTFVILKYV